MLFLLGRANIMIFNIAWCEKKKFVMLVRLLLSSFFPAKITYEIVLVKEVAGQFNANHFDYCW